MSRWSTEKHIYAAIMGAFSKGVNYQKGKYKYSEEDIRHLERSILKVINERYKPIDEHDKLDLKTFLEKEK